MSNINTTHTKQADNYFSDDYDHYSRESDLQINFQRADSSFFPEESNRMSIDHLSFASEGW